MPKKRRPALSGRGNSDGVARKVFLVSADETRKVARTALAFALLFGSSLCADAAQPVSPTFTEPQASAGRALYEQHCATCHGHNLDDGRFAPPLKSAGFTERWGGKSVASLFEKMKSTMPVAAPDSLGAGYVELLAYLLQQNNVGSGDQPLSTDLATMDLMVLPATQESHTRLAAGTVLLPPPGTVPANPLEQIRPVTEEMLNNPENGEWLTWRRTVDAHGFSPLKQINRNNVDALKLSWAWALANGPNESTPLVHDGIMFVYSHGDRVQALNAVTGDLLWQYVRRLPEGVAPSFKKGLAIFGSRLFVPTSDVSIVALDVKTGDVAWDSSVGDPAKNRMTGGPLIAKDKVIVGTSSFNEGVANYVVALDVNSGKEAWRFRTVPKPGEPGGDTWNDLPLEKRSGGSVWTPGSYDPDLNLVFFGPAPTYDTGPLRERKKNSSNSALYTNATIALNPDTGNLVWHYQHLPNDQWDLDWAFERQIVTLTVDGSPRKFVVTTGKPAIYEALDAATGKYAFSIDLGLQNFITRIDPNTGAKSIDSSLVPGDGQEKFVCPHAGGGKNWMPASYNPQSMTVFVPLNESCMVLRPIRSGERRFTTGLSLSLSPRLDSDGRFGRVQAINLETGKTAWTLRQRAPITMGTLVTAGGLVFTGSLDRVFAAHDAGTGKTLWSTRLHDVPNSNAITYAVDGKQYIAVISGGGGVNASQFNSLTPEIVNPTNRSSTIWVFETGRP